MEYNILPISSHVYLQPCDTESKNETDYGRDPISILICFNLGIVLHLWRILMCVQIKQGHPALLVRESGCFLAYPRKTGCTGAVLLTFDVRLFIPYQCMQAEASYLATSAGTC